MVPSLVAEEPPPTLSQELIAPSDARIVIVGRIDATDPNRPRLGYPGVTIHFRFTGSTAAVGLVSDTENSYIAAVVDHGEPRVYQVANGASELLIAKGLDAGPHTAEMVKRTGDRVEHGRVVIDDQHPDFCHIAPPI
jgi:hypothetical protein